MRRAPFVWLALTIALFLLMLAPAAELAVSPSRATQGVGWGTVGLIAYCVIAWIFVLPRMKPREGKTPSPERSATFLWAYASAPFLFGYAAITADGPQWAFGVGFLTSVVLLVSGVRRIRHGYSTIAS
jgi:hypothetical protein